VNPQRTSFGARLRSNGGMVGVAGVLLAIAGLTLFSLLGGGAEPLPTPTSSPTPGAIPPSPGPTPVATASAPSTVPPSPSPSPSPSPNATPLPPFAPLNGLSAEPELAHRLPIALMIDNNTRARPQAGFNRASIVYHAPNDGGTNRYMLIFQEQDAELVGPVRSTRLFFNGWAFEYRPAFGHFGGDWRSVKELREVDGQLVFNVDALAGSARAYWRDSSRRAPFNAYTDTQRLRTQASALGAPEMMVPGVGLRTFANDLPPSERPTSGTISIPYRGYPVAYRYDHESNAYLRSVGGEPQRDALDNSRVTARNVVVQFVDVYYDRNQRYNRAVMEFSGSGPAIVFRDGLAIEGRWEKGGRGELTRFVDGAGSEITLVRGRIFIQVVPLSAEVTYEVGPLP
jgi:hypothetical protein